MGFVLFCSIILSDVNDGNQAIANREWSKAISLYSRELAANPKSSDALVGRGIARLGSNPKNRGNIDLARIDFFEAEKISPNNPNLKAAKYHLFRWMAVGKLRKQADGLNFQAEREREKLLAIDPSLEIYLDADALPFLLVRDAESAKKALQGRDDRLKNQAEQRRVAQEQAAKDNKAQAEARAAQMEALAKARAENRDKREVLDGIRKLQADQKKQSQKLQDDQRAEVRRLQEQQKNDNKKLMQTINANKLNRFLVQMIDSNGKKTRRYYYAKNNTDAENMARKEYAGMSVYQATLNNPPP